MNNKEFVQKAVDIAGKYKTVYGWGTFGWPWNEAALYRVGMQYPNFYTAKKKIELQGFFGKGYFAFDCVGLIKGILWDWSGDQGKTYGGASYAVNGVPDIDANAMLNRCSGVSEDFSKIEPGEVVWLQGHIGIYIGDGKAVECTPSWKNGTQITAVTNIGSIAGLNGRKWTKHGKLPYITYVKETAPAPPVAANKAISVGDKVRITGNAYATGQAIPAWVKSTAHTVGKIDGTKALIGFPDGINSWVMVRDLVRI